MLRLLMLLVLLTLTGPALAQDSQAVIRFDKGVELTKLDDFEGALVEFRAAYEAEPDYHVLYNIGICLYKLGRYIEALGELTTYLAEGGEEIPEDRSVEVNDILKEITSYIGALKLSCNVDGAWILVDGKPAGETPLTSPLDIDVGEHLVEVNKKGHTPFKQTVEIPGGMTVSLDVTLQSIGEMTIEQRKALFKHKATGLFIAGAATSGVGLLIVPGTSLLYLANDDALETYIVPSMGLVGLAGLGILTASHTIAARNLAAMGVEEAKKTKSLRIASWVFFATTVFAEGFFFLANGLFNVYDGKLAGCPPDACTSERDKREAFMITSYLMMGALTGSMALSLGLSVAAWVLVGKHIRENHVTIEDLDPTPIAFVPTVTPVLGGAVVGLSGAF